MRPFESLKTQFAANWTTVLVGWNGLGGFSPWPGERGEFPPLLSPDDIATYANDRLASTANPTEVDLIVALLSLDLCTASRETIREHLARLSDVADCDASRELRKWRLVLLEDLLDNIPSDAVYGLIALTEFWADFGFPADSPHEVQGREDAVSPSEYYTDQNFRRLLDIHRAWIQCEKATLQQEEEG